MRRALPALLAAAASAARTSRPKHVIAVIIDDLGYDDLGFRNQNQIKTPHFNDLAENGIVLSNYYVQPSCSPTRATIMTGRKPLHTGINVWIPNLAYGLKLDEVTFADVLNARGYTSHAVGKWHLGFHKTGFTPTFRGFSSFYGYYEGSEDYFKHTTSGGLDFHYEEGLRCGPSCTQLLWDEAGNYSTNLYGARATKIIEQHDAGTPLFLYLAWQGVHSPRQSPASYVAPYADTIKDGHRRTFAGMISALDEGMGNVSAALRAKGMRDDTLFFVTTDNGGPTTECAGIGASNFPFRGSKCSIWEGGTRGTAFLYWSGMPAAVQGTVWGGLAHAADWLPTVLSGVGSPVRAGETLPLDGIDLWDALMGNASSPRTDVYYGIAQINQQKPILGPAVRDAEGWKLILAGSGGGKGQWSPEQLPGAAAPAPWYEGGASPHDAWYEGVAPACNPVPGVCFPSHDIDALNVSNSSACCDACSATGGCVAWTYNTKGTKGNCYVKSAVGEQKSGDTCTSGVVGCGDGVFPRDLNGTQCMGLQRDASAASAAECARSCCDKGLATCSAWQWADKAPASPAGSCWLGHSAQCAASKPGWVGRGATAPPQPPAEPGHLLFYLPDDAGERSNVTTDAAAAAVARLKAIAEAYQATAVPQQTGDPACPKFAPRTSARGKWIGPYCD